MVKWLIVDDVLADDPIVDEKINLRGKAITKAAMPKVRDNVLGTLYKPYRRRKLRTPNEVELWVLQ